MKYTVFDWLLPIACIANAIIYGGDIAEGNYFTLSLLGMSVALFSIYVDMYVRGKK